MTLTEVHDNAEPGDPDAGISSGRSRQSSDARSPQDDESMARTKLIGTIFDAILAEMPRSGVRGF